MDTAYSPEQEAFRDSLRRYLAEKCDQAVTRDNWDEAIPHGEELWQPTHPALLDMNQILLLECGTNAEF